MFKDKKAIFWEKFFYRTSIVLFVIGIYFLLDWDLEKSKPFILVSFIFVVTSIFYGGFNMTMSDKDYVWESNNGPRVMDRVRIFKNKETGDVKIYHWVGGQYGHYFDSKENKKYDYYLQEIK
jgi:hypothetical protein